MSLFFNRTLQAQSGLRAISKRRTGLAMALGAMTCLAGNAEATILEDWLENKNESRVHVDKGQVTNDTGTKRNGEISFRCTLNRSTNRRSELEARTRVNIDTVNWYGWSMRVDNAWPNGASAIINQFATYPTNNKNFWRDGASGNGSHIIIGREGGDVKYGSNNRVTFVLQHQGDSDGIKVTTFDLGHVNNFKNKWTDFVMETRWTGDSDGYLKLWYRPLGAKNWGSPKINYSGTTFWNDEGKAPYFKAGLYAGSPGSNWKARRRVWFDSYRHGNSSSYLNQVRPR